MSALRTSPAPATPDDAPSSESVPPDRFAASPPIPGASVRLEDFIAEQALMLGAGSTVMYQLAMKGVGLGVAEHSTTLQRPVDRLRTTLSYVYVMTLGTLVERQAIARMVNKAHGPVRSTGRYSAFDPDLQLWVAATLARNGEIIHERVFGPLDEVSREQVYRDAQIFGNALQVRPDMWPATRAEFEDYWEASLARLEADPAVQCFAKQLLSTHGQGPLIRLVLPLQSLMTRGNLDPHTRAVLALPWSRRDEQLYDLFWRFFVPVYRLLPRRLRHLHAHLVLRDMRRRMRLGKRVI